MGVFDNINSRKKYKEGSTKGFYFGASEAEGENNGSLSLNNYFKDYLEILDNLNEGCFIFTGRKGVGKSAIAKFIKDTSDKSDDSFSKILKFSDFELEKIIQKSELDTELERLFFEWLILVNVVKLIIKNECGSYTKEYNQLQKFLDNNSGLVNVDSHQVVEIVKNNGGEVKFGVLAHAFGGVFKRHFGVKATKAPFYKMIPPLKEILNIILDYDVNKSFEFWILFDDLDINFSASNEADNTRIMELIRLSKDFNNEIFKDNNARIVLFLREDMKKSVVSRYPDSAKVFKTYEIPINWYDHDSFVEDENSTPLKKLVNRRVKLNFERLNIRYNNCDPWLTLFDDHNIKAFTGKSTFKYIADFTFYRPRDFINFLSLIGKNDYKYPIGITTLKKLIDKYIAVNINEIKSELGLFFSETDKNILFSCVFPYLVENSNVRYSNLIELIESVDFSMTASQVIDTLVGYNLIIFRDTSGRLYFNYREKTELDRIGKENLTFTLPKCIYHYYRQVN